MKNLTYLTLILTLLFTSCEKEKPFTSASKNLSEADLDVCKNNTCPSISITYLSYSGNRDIVFPINSEINNFIIKSLYWGDMTNPDYAPTVEIAAEDFVTKYREDLAEFPDLPAEFEADVKVSELYRSENLLSLEKRQYKYTGGAHGYSTVGYSNFNLASGEALTNKQLFKDYGAFEKVAEETFREKFSISKQDSINSTGFWFENNTFSVLYPVGISEKEIIIHYNQYDIASYADGPIRIEIPKEKLKDNLAFQP